MTTEENAPFRETLIQKYLDEDITREEFEKLEAALRSDPETRERYWKAARTVGLLREIAGKEDIAKLAENEPFSPAPYSRTTVTSLAAAAVLMALLVAVVSRKVEPVAAILVSGNEPAWLSEEILPESEIRNRDRLQLASGSVEILFESGASTTLFGPALLEIDSRNSAFLHYGQTYSIANTDSSHGFTIRTPTSSFVDQGTEFMTTASPDGFSQLLVASGAVDVKTDGFEDRRIVTGNGLGIEIGKVPVMIQIESGTETPDFHFPSIPPPSDEDFADQNRGNEIAIEWQTRGANDKKSGIAPGSAPQTVLIDGNSPQSADEPGQSFFFRDNRTGYIIFDLGNEEPVSRIHTYSWHRNRSEPELTLRAVQRYTVWGCGNERPTNLPTQSDQAGWKRIARVDTDVFFHVSKSPGRPPQQACRIFSNTDTLGSFRYLVFEVLPTSNYDHIEPRHTFFSEIDIFTKEDSD